MLVRRGCRSAAQTSAPISAAKITAPVIQIQGSPNMLHRPLPNGQLFHVPAPATPTPATSTPATRADASRSIHYSMRGDGGQATKGTGVNSKNQIPSTNCEAVLELGSWFLEY